jgi:formylglycine-generating enzyme required for sulfatase activity
MGHIPAKIRTGLRDIYGAVFKDSSDMNWDLKSRPEHAVKYAEDKSCVYCHQELFPLELSHEGMDAHLYYDRQQGAVACIKCHIDAGHYQEGVLHAANVRFGETEELPDTLYMEPEEVKGFTDYSEKIPGSPVSFNMIAVPGGTFTMGAVEGDRFAEPDEYPAREVTVDSFFMAEIEVTWNEYLAWYSQTASEGRTTDIGMLEGIDGLTGATPPYGNPDQGWGKGKRPAITMTHYAAEKYCEWLSVVTGKLYRLPTEAEWEYAARGGTSGIYFFGGTPRDYAEIGLKRKLFGVDTSVINSYTIYAENSGGRSQLPSRVKANPFGLKNMLGNVAEFCADTYREDAYLAFPGPATNPLVEQSSGEHVIRGGSFRSPAIKLRLSDRESTDHDAWLKTDPQFPKSLWWYSDCYDVGFRVVRTYHSN